jgi:hypothetical protein
MTNGEVKSLAVVYDEELNRNRQLLIEYNRMPPESGWFGKAVLTELISRAEKAARDGDVVAMVAIYAELQESA